MFVAKLNQGPEIFYTVQGEGKNMGMPSVFLRLSRCNLHCIWCDTDYTWNFKGTRFRHKKEDLDANYQKFDRKEMMVELQSFDVAQRVKAFGCKHLVLTGGEPMLQQKELADLMTILKREDDEWFFEIETNATVMPSARFDHLVSQYNVSPKLENSGNAKTLRERKNCYEFFAQSEKAYFKYVIASPDDLREVMQLIATYQIPKKRVFLMPEGLNANELKQKQQWLVEICKEHGFRYTDRLHIHIFGDKRGV